MSRKRIRNFLKDGAKLYLRQTSVHGFRYALETHEPLLKGFWLLSIFMAFCACFTLIHDNLVDEREKPTITTNEEILLDDLPAPAFSILVPEVDASAYLRMRMPNSARACDAKVNVSQSEFLKQYLVVTKAIHKAVRKAYVPSDDEVVDFARQMRNQLNYPLYPRFCAAMSELNSTGRSILVKELTSRIDSFLMVSDLEGMVSGLLPAIMNGSHPDECDQNKTLLDSNVVREWMILNAPLAFKENHGYKCSVRYDSNVIYGVFGGSGIYLAFQAVFGSRLRIPRL